MCHNCGSEAWDPVQSENHWICNICGGWSVDLDSKIDFASIYGQDYYTGSEYLNYELSTSIRKLNFQKKIKKIKDLYPDFSKLRVLEIGSASGDFLQLLKNDGCSLHVGIEISDYTRNIARDNGLEVISPFDPNASEIIKALRPNLIVAWDVWEHLPTPTHIFDEYISYCDENLIIGITTVDSESFTAKTRQEKWRQFHPPSHIHYPSKRSLYQFFKLRQFSIIEQFYIGYYRPLAEYLYAIFPKIQLFKRSKLLFRIPLYINLYDIQCIFVGRHGGE
jgi:hypothetical protein